MNFVKTFSSNASAREKIDALRRACKSHTALTKQCASGLGQDRILYAMYCLAQQRRKRAQRARTASMSGGSAIWSSSSDEDDSDGPQGGLAGAEVSARIAARIPQLFKDPGYAQLGHSTISTSNCGDPSLAYFGFGPVVSDGLGIGYIIKVSLVVVFFLSLSFFLAVENDLTKNACPAGRLYRVLRVEQAPANATLPRCTPVVLDGGVQSPEAAALRSEPEAKLCTLFPRSPTCRLRIP